MAHAAPLQLECAFSGTAADSVVSNERGGWLLASSVGVAWAFSASRVAAGLRGHRVELGFLTKKLV